MQLDKTYRPGVDEGLGTIDIRVVVLEKQMAATSSTSGSELPVDAVSDEMLPETDKRPTSTFLEESKKGRQVCVFLINGQRQHVWDNQFIIRDLGLKYLRNRMLVVVECDGLKPEAIAELMQGSRHQFYEGHVYGALESRVLATLKGDPDLRRLEEEAEEEIASLQAGDEVVKAALDQLIEAHHDAAAHVEHGQNQPGEASRQDSVSGKLIQTQSIVKEADPSVGVPASDPVLQIRPDVAALRLKPNQPRRFTVHTRPEDAWKGLQTLAVTFDPPVKELEVARSTQLSGEELTLKFAEPEEFDDDEYPIETMLRVTALIAGFTDARIVERRVVVTPPKERLPRPRKPLVDDPSFIKVTSRQPIKLFLGGPDVHVKMRWDGKDELAVGNPPQWIFRVSCESPSAEPTSFLTTPRGGGLELLIQVAPGLQAGDQIKFDVEAIGPGKTLSTAFLADVVELPTARKLTSKVGGGGQRRPPYELVYVKRENWGDDGLACFNQPWSGLEAGAFDPPDTKSPLMIFINQDTDLLTAYRDSLLARKLNETTISQRVNKYTAHVAFHLYLMYLKQKSAEERGNSYETPSEDMMREEIQRVGQTLIKLMEVTQ